jgi:hypothetical protein
MSYRWLDGLNHQDRHSCIQKTLESLFFAQVLSGILIFCIPNHLFRHSDNRRTEEKNTMDLQYLEFDCSEDTEGTVCWDALAQPAPAHTSALLREVTQLLIWASRQGLPGPGPLDEGTDWDFDLQVKLHTGSDSIPTSAVFHPEFGSLTLQPEPQNGYRLELSLSLSGTPGFADAFRQQWRTD